MKTIIVLFVVLFGSLGASADVVYTVTDLGTLGGGSSQALGINNRGQIVGWSYDNNNFQRAFLYSNGVMLDLGSLGGANSYAYGLNDAGQVVGRSEIASGDRHACLWQNGTAQDIGPSDDFYSQAQSINNNGVVVGYSVRSGSARGFRWQNGAIDDISPLVQGNSINNSGQVVGWAPNIPGNGVESAFLWDNGSATNLGIIPGYGRSVAHAINNLGDVVGTSYNNEGFRAALWADGPGSAISLGTQGRTHSIANAINDNGQAVGLSFHFSANDGYAFLWENGVMTDLDLIIHGAAGIRMFEARGINNSGQIITNGSNGRAYLLTPIPSPTTLAVLSLGSLIVLPRRRK